MAQKSSIRNWRTETNSAKIAEFVFPLVKVRFSQADSCLWLIGSAIEQQLEANFGDHGIPDSSLLINTSLFIYHNQLSEVYYEFDKIQETRMPTANIYTLKGYSSNSIQSIQLSLCIGFPFTLLILHFWSSFVLWSHTYWHYGSQH